MGFPTGNSSIVPSTTFLENMNFDTFFTYSKNHAFCLYCEPYSVEIKIHEF